jgi:hypothetical protein
VKRRNRQQATLYTGLLGSPLWRYPLFPYYIRPGPLCARIQVQEARMVAVMLCTKHTKNKTGKISETPKPIQEPSQSNHSNQQSGTQLTMQIPIPENIKPQARPDLCNWRLHDPDPDQTLTSENEMAFKTAHGDRATHPA